jgi:hypothetical protein
LHHFGSLAQHVEQAVYTGKVGGANPSAPTISVLSDVDVKTCSRCDTPKPIGEFYRRGDGHQSYCKGCSGDYRDDYYQEHPERVVDRVKRYHRNLRVWLTSLKEGKPCKDCSNVFPPYVMDFDHRPGEAKLFTISNSIMHRGKDEILHEIKKCDLVCANCHRIRTHQRRFAPKA